MLKSTTLSRIVIHAVVPDFDIGFVRASRK
jgi:hypothetical protein